MLRAEIEQVKETARQIATEEIAGLKKELAGKIAELDQKIQQVAAAKQAAAKPAVKGA